MLPPSLFILWCLFSYPTAGQQITHGNSTADPIVGWQDNPSQRGTLNIVESCFFVIVACTWSVQHLNLPSPEDNVYIILGRKLKWTVITALFPEFILVHAILERFMAVDSLEHIKQLSKEQRGGQEWTLTHAYYANMGGFRMDKKTAIAVWDNGAIILNAYQLAVVVQRNVIPALPKVSLEEIEDRSKSDSFTKGLAIVQIMALAISLIVRAVRQLPVSQLEILTVAFAVCTITTYAFCWSKPQNVRTPLWISLDPSESKRLRDLNDTLRPLQADKMVQYLLHPNGDLKTWHNPGPFSVDRVPNDGFRWSESIVQPLGLITALTTAAFDAIHLVAWNFSFPTVVEKDLWRVAALVTIVLPITLLAANIIRWTWFCIKALRKPLPMFTDREEVKRYLTLTAARSRRSKGGFENPPLPTEDDAPALAWIHWLSQPDYEWYDLQAENELLDEKKLDYLVSILGRIRWHVLQVDRNAPLDMFQVICDISKQKAHWRYRMNYNFPLLYNERYRRLARDKKSPVKGALRLLGRIFLIFCGIIYLVARLSVIAIAVSALRAMPSGVFVTTWAKYIPFVQ